MSQILLVFALVFLILAGIGIGVDPPRRWHLGWIGLAFYVASILFNGVLPLHHFLGN
jgi:hypothetical protein